MMSRKSANRLNVKKVLADFQKAEESSARRNGTFKIDAPFDDALKTILKAKPEPNKRNHRSKKESAR